MPSINVDVDYFEHRKVIRLVGLLGKGAEVLPLRLWCYCGRYHKDGKLTGYSAQEIESVVRWWGNDGACIEAMLDPRINLLEATSNGFLVHDWEEWQGHLEAASVRGKAAARARWDKIKSDKPPPDAPSNACAMQPQCDSHASSNALTKQSDAEQSKAGRGAPSANSAEIGGSLADLFWLAQVGPKEDKRALEQKISEMLRVGYDSKRIESEISDQSRDRGELFWKLKARLEKEKDSTNAARVQLQPEGRRRKRDNKFRETDLSGSAEQTAPDTDQARSISDADHP